MGSQPANPFAQVSDGAIEYFVEWSLEQSTKHKARMTESSFANVKMAAPLVETKPSPRRPLLIGIAVGVVVGAPLGGVATYYALKQTPYAPLVAHEVQSPTPQPVATIDLGAIALAATTTTAAPVPTEPRRETKLAEARPEKKAATSKPVTKPPEAKTEAKAQSRPEAKPTVASKPESEPDEGEGKPGELQVQSKPPGAQVTVDGSARGKTPLALSLPAGEHEVRLDKERYASWTQSVGVPGKVDVTMRRPSATLHVESDPPGGDVIVEGKPRGKTPVDVTLDAFHHYDVQVTLLGTHPWRKRVSLKPPQTDVMAKLSVLHAP
jgi:hypothetical protein